MTDLAGAAAEFADLARNLRLVGEEELRAELYKAIDEASRPLMKQIGSTANLDAHLPNRYAAVLARDLSIRASKRAGTTDVGVFIQAKGARRWRHVRRMDQGILTHPVFGSQVAEARALALGRGHGGGHGRGWTWVEQKVLAGFFTFPIETYAPQIRDQILAAMGRIADRVTGRP